MSGVLSRAAARLSALAASIDAMAARFGRRLDVIAWTLLYAVAAGAGSFVAGRSGLLPLLDHNQVPRSEARAMLGWVAAALAGIVAIHAGALAAARGRASRRGAAPPAAGEVLAAVTRRLRPILALPLVEALALPAIERDRPAETLLLVALVAVIAGAGAHAWMRSPARPRADGSAGLAAALLAALWAGYAIFFARLAIINHHALNTRTVSLGFYDNIFWQSSHGHPLGCSFLKAGHHGSAHFDPILVLLSPIYLVYPRAELLLAAQAVWLGAGVVPLYLLGRAAELSRRAAIALAAMYVVHPALHAAALYEFHSLTLAAPITLSLLYFLETGAHRRYGVALAAALLVREDMAFLLVFVWLYAVLSSRPRVGWITIGASAAYFVIVKRFFMTSPDIFMTGRDAYSFAHDFDALMPWHDGAPGILVSLATNPVFALRTILAGPKLAFVVTVFLPLAFLPFLARPGRVMLAWGLGFCLLATRPALSSVHFHYPCILLPAAFAVVPAALSRVSASARLRAAGVDGARLRRALLASALAASALVSWKLGGLVENASFRAGYLPVVRALGAEERAAYAWVEEQAGKIPRDARLGVTNRLGPHASNRRAVHLYPERDAVDWLLIDEAELAPADRARHDERVQAGVFALVARRGPLAVYRRAP